MLFLFYNLLTNISRTFLHKGELFMTERLRDFIYDCSDIILTLLIIGCMFLVISWKVTDIMGISLYPESDKTSLSADYNLDNGNLIEENNEAVESSEDDLIIIEESESVSTSNESVVQIAEEIKEVTIDIPKGTFGVGVAKILLEKGLIDSSSEFISRIEELGLAPKLKFGTFTLKSNNSIDEIIHILTK